LEYEVEKGYIERGIEAGERKTVFKALVKKTLEKSMEGSLWQKEDLKNLIISELNEKNILLFFKNSGEQEIINKLGWSGQVDQSYQGDYLMIVEANLGGGKSNAFIEREIEYFVDLSKDIPVANLKIKYTHSNVKKDWFNDDYRAYLRIYVPNESWLLASSGMENETEFLDEFGKTVFGNWIVIPAGETKTVEFSYLLPNRFKDETDYQILVQKQPGINNLHLNLMIKGLKGNNIIEKEAVIINNLEEKAPIQ
ncbi:MAG: hypothetical protein U9P88_01785, partial [Patescibacteria group bacterium]|nr:hypothetical protein [Patescibacteria group bacterium]